MKNHLLLLFALLIFSSSQAQRNVLVIIADDLGTDYFGFYEDAVDTVDVPNIRALKNRGVRFKSAYANPVCSATRSTILTGRYSFRTGVGNIVGGIGGSGVLDTAEVSIPKVLRAYNPNIARANIGKWHLHQPNPASNLTNPNRMGYERFEGPFIGQLTSFTNWTKYTNGVSSNVTTYATSENVNNAVTWLKTTGTRPFFLWLAFNAPHTPYHLPPANLHTYNTLSGTTQNINQNPKAYFKASLQALDTEIGRLMDSLRVLNKLDSTDIIFMGDNGNTQQTAQISNTNRAKGTIYEYGIHIPFIVAGPSVVGQGRASEAIINVADIFATVPELMGYNGWRTQIPANKPVDAVSLVPIIKNQVAQVRPWVFSENFKVTPDASDGKCMRDLEYKLIRFDSGIEEFYNLVTDPTESSNLLLRALNSTEVVHYNYLCNEMTTLVGRNVFCNPAVGVEDLSSREVMVFPNPFDSYIHAASTSELGFCQLINAVGQLIYEGMSLSTQDFSKLPSGVYFLRWGEKNTNCAKLQKH